VHARVEPSEPPTRPRWGLGLAVLATPSRLRVAPASRLDLATSPSTTCTTTSRASITATPTDPVLSCATALAAAQDGGDKGRVGNVVEHHLFEVMLRKFGGAPLAVRLGFEAKSPLRLRATFVPLARNTDGYERRQGMTGRTT
jgi:hypothetical protein